MNKLLIERANPFIEKKDTTNNAPNGIKQAGTDIKNNKAKSENIDENIIGGVDNTRY